MTIGRTRTFILVAALLVPLLSVSSAHALNPVLVKCSQTLGKAGLGFVKGKLKLIQKCKNANLKDSSCSAPATDAVTKLENKLAAAIDKACGALTQAQINGLGVPGPCPDATPPFTLAELKSCMKTSHETIVDQMIALEYDATVTPTLDKAHLGCQAEVAKQSGALVACILKNVQKCRNAINKGTPVGVPADVCATSDPKTAAAITKCRDKLTAGLLAKCSDSQINDLKVCTPDKMNRADATTCLLDEHTVRTDSPEIAVAPDLIDYEYFTRGGVCGDGVVNSLDEECDGTDDSACPDACGTALVPDGHFACLCKTKPRMVIVEHANADTDNGWKGVSMDGHVVEGGNYLVDLYDCDGGGLCIVGPNCALPPHAPCAVPFNAPSGTTSDSLCPGVGNFCRKERTANGPHCYKNINKKCDLTNSSDPICNASGDFCTTAFHGPPVATSAGGVSVCNISIFSEDVVGTANINDGTAAVKVRQRARTYTGLKQNKPCPVCGGFCGVSRDRCTTNGDCGPGAGICITEPICSDGPQQDKPCRATPPFGGSNTYFGVTSVDCPVSTGQDEYTNNGGLDINANPRTTGTVTLLPTFPCSAGGFTDNTCVGGSSEGRICTGASECPGGTCNGQCFCAGQEQPNVCLNACVGGPNDAVECADDSECPSGFCHGGDCRFDPSDTDSNQEGICASGPIVGHCSVTLFRGCNSDMECTVPGGCPFCTTGETCILTNRACFVNSSIVRHGTPRLPNGESAAIYCVPGNKTAINVSAGFPGPGALIQRETMIVVP